MKAPTSFRFEQKGPVGVITLSRPDTDMGAAHLLPRLVGLGRATELLYFGDAVDAATAERYGLFNKVVPQDQVLSEAMAWAKRLAEGPTFAIGMTKELLDEEASQ